MALLKSTFDNPHQTTDGSFIPDSDSTGYHAINGVATRLLREQYSFLATDLIPILLDTTDCRSYDILAEDLIPGEYAINPTVAKKIIHLAAQAAVDIYNSDLPEGAEFIDLDTRSSRVKSQTNINRESGRVMLEAMGRHPFSFEEICMVVDLMQNPEFIWQQTGNIGKPNWNKIAIIVNQRFGCKRSAKSIADQIKTMRYAQDARLAAAYAMLIEEEAEEDSVFYIDKFVEKIILEKELYERFASDIAYILNDLTDLRSYAEIVRDLMPEEFEFGTSAANQIVSMIVDLIRFDTSFDFNEELFEQRKIIINVNRKRVISLADKMLENQGVIRFCRAEFERFMVLRRECVRQDGPQVGRTDYVEVAKILNEEFHDNNNSRTPEKLSSLIRAYRQNHKKKPYMYPSMDDTDIPICVLVDSYFLPEVIEQ